MGNEMIITRTPLRISFVGGGTDFRDFYRQEPGMVVSTTINKYVDVIVKPRFDELIVLNYSQKERVKDVQEIQHEFIREAMIRTGVASGIEITTLAAVPSQGSGLGSSSSVLVGLLNAFYAYTGRQVSEAQLALDACEIEIHICGKPVGKQDQYAVAVGGVALWIFHQNGQVEQQPITISSARMHQLSDRLLLFFTGTTRKSSEVLADQRNHIPESMGTLTAMKKQAPLLKGILEAEDTSLDDVGRLLDEAWQYKQQLSPLISTPQITTMYETAKHAGAIGGKIAGAGGGGFLLLYVPTNRQPDVRTALTAYREIPFTFDRAGSRFILNTGVE